MQRFRRRSSDEPELSDATSDEQLIAAAREGNLHAFNMVISRHERSVYNLCYRLLGSTAEAEDATQDTFLRAWQAVGRFQGDMVRPWLYRIATNRCYDSLRATSRHPTDSLSGEEDASEVAVVDTDTLTDPVLQSERRELASVLQLALDALPLEQKLAVILCDIQRFSYDEASSIAGVPAGTLKSRAFRGRERMRVFLLAQPETRELLGDKGRSPYE